MYSNLVQSRFVLLYFLLQIGLASLNALQFEPHLIHVALKEGGVIAPPSKNPSAGKTVDVGSWAPNQE